MATLPTPRTEDDQHVHTITHALADLATIRNGPSLPEEAIRTVDTTNDPLLETDGTAYGDHLRALFDWVTELQADLNCETLFDHENNLHWSDDLLTPPIAEADPDEEYDHAAVRYRLVDARPFDDADADGAPLFELTLDYYTTGEVVLGLALTTGYKVADASDGDDRLETTFVYSGDLDDFSPYTVEETIADLAPFVVSYVTELVHKQGVTLSHARAIALAHHGLKTDEIADRLDVGSAGTIRGYKSKFNTETDRAERRVVAHAGGTPKTILAVNEFDRTQYASERWYACHAPYHAETRGEYSVVRVQEEQRDGPGLTVRTERFDSLAALIRETYTQARFTDEYRAEGVRDFIAAIPATKREAAGYETLPHPLDRLDERVP